MLFQCLCGLEPVCHFTQADDEPYGIINITTSGHEKTIKIGNYVSIACNVWFVINNEHNLHTISTYPFKTLVLQSKKTEAIAKGDIIIQDDVWIGAGAIIMSNLVIGQGAVVAAGALVTKDVPPYAVVGGVPAKVIKYRFNEKIRKKLIKIDFSRITDDLIKEHIADFYEEINEETKLDWLPQKEESIRERA